MLTIYIWMLHSYYCVIYRLLRRLPVALQVHSSRDDSGAGASSASSAGAAAAATAASSPSPPASVGAHAPNYSTFGTALRALQPGMLGGATSVSHSVLCATSALCSTIVDDEPLFLNSQLGLHDQCFLGQLASLVNSLDSILPSQREYWIKVITFGSFTLVDLSEALLIGSNAWLTIDALNFLLFMVARGAAPGVAVFPAGSLTCWAVEMQKLLNPLSEATSSLTSAIIDDCKQRSVLIFSENMNQNHFFQITVYPRYHVVIVTESARLIDRVFCKELSGCLDHTAGVKRLTSAPPLLAVILNIVNLAYPTVEGSPSWQVVLRRGPKQTEFPFTNCALFAAANACVAASTSHPTLQRDIEDFNFSSDAPLARLLLASTFSSVCMMNRFVVEGARLIGNALGLPTAEQVFPTLRVSSAPVVCMSGKQSDLLSKCSKDSSVSDIAGLSMLAKGLTIQQLDSNSLSKASTRSSSSSR